MDDVRLASVWTYYRAYPVCWYQFQPVLPKHTYQGESSCQTLKV